MKLSSISKRDKCIVLGLLAIVIGVLYYTFIYQDQSTKLETSESEKQEAITEYNRVIAELETLEERKSNIKELIGGAQNKSAGFYPEIDQAKLILELEDLLKKTEFDGNISFSEITVNTIEDLSPAPEAIAPTVFDPLALVIRADEEKDDKQAVTSYSGSEEVSPYASTTTCQTLSVTITFKSSYAKLKAFKEALEDYDRAIICPTIAIQAVGSDISGTISLEIFGIPKVSATDEDNEYLKWTIKNIYGKEELFSEGAASGTIEDISNKETQYDFVGLVKAPSSVYPTLTFGKGNDAYKETYIYDDSDKVIDVVLTLTEVDGKYYYKYSANDKKYPESSMGNGKAFVPNGDVITVNIDSEARIGSQDKSGINLKVINNTNKSVEVKINSDETAKRVNLESEGGSVYKK